MTPKPEPSPATYPFDPDWVVAPGETLVDWFEEMHLPHRIAWEVHDIPERTLNGVLRGTTKITPKLAQKLCNLTLIGAPMWLALEHNFRVGLAAGKSWAGASAEQGR